MRAKRIGVFGGTFDPIHQGHLHVAKQLCERLQLDEMRMMLAPQPPHRVQPQATAAQRWQMLQLALQDSPELIADDRELRRQGPSYSFDTLSELRIESGPEALFVFCLGWDSLVSFPSWHRWRELLDLCVLAVVNRPHHVEGETPLNGELARRLIPSADNPVLRLGQIVEIVIVAVPVSATQVREGLAAGRELPGNWLAPGVTQYIKQNQLYGT